MMGHGIEGLGRARDSVNLLSEVTFIFDGLCPINIFFAVL